MQGRVKDWFQKCETRNFGIELPSGWLGRPFDNFHSLEKYEITEKEIWLMFDEGRELRIKINAFPEVIIENNMPILKFDKFSHIDFLWFPYGEEIENKKTISFNQGILKLYGYHFET